MWRDSIMALAETINELSKAAKRAAEAFRKSCVLDEPDLPRIMREAQQAINGDYEQFIMCN